MKNQMARLTCFIVLLAFCSMVYELILAQTLTAFLENTILRYSITIGLYLFSMGVGAFLAEGRVTAVPALTLLGVEILLTLLGGCSVIILHGVDALGLPAWGFSIVAYGAIIGVGILTGMELPLLMALSRRQQGYSQTMILALNYAGALLGTVVFAFVFYAWFGLLASAFAVGMLNAVAGSCLVLEYERIPAGKKRTFYAALTVQVILLMGMECGLMNAVFLQEFLSATYLG